jgi:ABC-type sugar transport system permease subunit
MLSVRPAPGAARRGLRTGSWLDRCFARLASLPALTLAIAVCALPLGFTVYLSFTTYQWSIPSLSFHGLASFKLLFENPATIPAFERTSMFVAGGSAIEFPLGLALAGLLSHRVRWIGLYRAIYAIPVLATGVASAVAWGVLLRGGGWASYLLGELGLGRRDWLADPHLAMLCTIFVDAWTNAPVVGLFVLAGLLPLERDPEDAATLDGASSIRTFARVTLPRIKTVVVAALLFDVVQLFRQEMLFQTMTGTGPDDSTAVVNSSIYGDTQAGFLGQGAGLSLLLVVLVLLVLVVLWALCTRAQPLARLAHRSSGRSVGGHDAARRRRPRARGDPGVYRLRRRRKAMRRPAADALVALALTAGAAVVLVPIAWLVITALHRPAAAVLTAPTLANFYQIASNQAPAIQYPADVAHSLILMGLAGALALLLGVPAGYGLAHAKGVTVRLLAVLLALAYLAPPVVYMVPFFYLSDALHIYGSYASLVGYQETFALPIVAFLTSVWFRKLPADLQDSARTDGGSERQVFTKVALPLARSGICAAALLVAAQSLNEYVGASILTLPSTMTAPVSIMTFLSASPVGGETQLPVFAAAALLLIVPAVVLAAAFEEGYRRQSATG